MVDALDEARVKHTQLGNDSRPSVPNLHAPLKPTYLFAPPYTLLQESAACLVHLPVGQVQGMGQAGQVLLNDVRDMGLPIVHVEWRICCNNL